MIEYIICGLGNPEPEYDNTRHNAGFWAANEFGRRNGLKKIKKLKFFSTYAICDNVLLLKPQTYMNRSGRALRAAAEYYNIPAENIIVVYDEVALPPGKLRIRAKGSDGGHNGIKDILYQLQAEDFARVRIGVGGSENPEIPLSDWVLQSLSVSERKLLEEAAVRAADACEYIMEHGVLSAMNEYNGKGVV